MNVIWNEQYMPSFKIYLYKIELEGGNFQYIFNTDYQLDQEERGEIETAFIKCINNFIDDVNRRLHG